MSGLSHLLLRLGFVEATRGSHLLFRRPELGLLVNLESAGLHGPRRYRG